MARQKLFLLIAFLLIVFLPQYSQAGMGYRVKTNKITRSKDITGRIYYLANGKGISNLVVKLTPSHRLMERIEPNDREKLKERTSVTDQDGNFMFTNLPEWRYLLEVYNGPALLYHNLVDMDKETNKNVILKGKGKVIEPNIKLIIIPSEFKYE
jgi:hypothetical protein